jgi:uncharacterized protein (TIGR02452 family)
MDKTRATQAAQETMAILQNGFYINSKGTRMELQELMTKSIQGAVLYSPEQGDSLLLDYSSPAQPAYQTVIEVTGETTLAAADRAASPGHSVCCLNFASAKNPGGGFLTGARAQEESLARSSGLYPTIVQMKEMYDYNSRSRTAFYSDYMIFSPDVPVLRKDDGSLLHEPQLFSIITAPAVNAGVVREREPGQAHRIPEVMRRRMEKILAVALHHKQEVLILGAFGCGVFRNDPEEVAQLFQEVLKLPQYRHAFRKVIFAVYDTSPQKRSFYAFKKRFG